VTTPDVAVIITAYQAQWWLGDCLASVRAAVSRSGLDVDVRLGVDGCEDSAAWCEAHDVPFFWSARNRGTYVMRNSLVALAPARAYAIFDADDVMLPSYLCLLWLRLQLGADLAGASRVDVGQDLEAAGATYGRYMNGVCMLTHDTWHRLGGYQAERYGADADLIERAALAGCTVEIVDQPLYLRRCHPQSLSRATETNSMSMARRRAAERMAGQRARQGWRNTPVTTRFTARVHL
jgi:GT2 family glycosyltransferase